MKISREIKFRGKKASDGKWIYANGIHYDGVKASIIFFDVDLMNDYAEYQAVEVIPETLGQYTGLNDKNGVEIYEGDIVQYKPEEVIYTVMFDPTGYWCLDGNGARNGEMLIQLDDTNKHIEIIGNIYDGLKDSDD